MSAISAIQVAVTFTWLGMVLAISFLETPLKFRAPGVTVPLAVGIGRLVFRALNRVEAVFAFALVVTVLLSRPPAPWWSTALIAAVVVVLVAGGAVLRPAMDSRFRHAPTADRPVGSPTGHRLHAAYVVLECVKALLLLAIGVTGLLG